MNKYNRQTLSQLKWNNEENKKSDWILMIKKYISIQIVINKYGLLSQTSQQKKQLKI
ncbi:hypothetical protein pb186bvf_015057 [Paramecium bursaria]